MSLIGKWVGHIQIVESLGKGGMGEVFVGFDQTLQRRVALKAIRARHRLNDEAKGRFLREARVLSQLDHPNICRIHDYVEDADRDFLVLELIRGRSLAEAIEAGLDPADQARISRRIAEALVAAHEKGLVHRDLKPQNVMLSDEGETKLLDFGLARAVSPDDGGPAGNAVPAWTEAAEAAPDPSLPTLALTEAKPGEAATAGSSDAAVETRHGSVVGTPAYMSPEQARGEPATAASDMYSFGLLLGLLSTGRLKPFRDQDWRAVDADLRALIQRLQSAAPAARPTAVEALARLRWIRDKPKRRLRRLLATAALLLLAAGVFKYTLDLRRQRAIADTARVEADRRRDQAEGLISFMLGDLREKLTAVGRLEILDTVGEEALAYFASLPADQLTDEELSRRSQALGQIGEVRMAQGDLQAARQAFQESLRLAGTLRSRDPTSIAPDQELVRSAEALNNIGSVRLAEGDLRAAQEIFDQALAVAEALDDRDPDHGAWQKLLGASYFWVGNLDWLRGDLDSALSRFRAYMEVAERLVAGNPDDSEWRLELAYAHSNIGSVLEAKGQLEPALAEFRTTLEIKRELVELEPENADWQLDFAVTHNSLGAVLEGLGRMDEALEHYRDDLEIKGRLVARDPTNTTWQNLLATSHNYLGRALESQGAGEPALGHFRSQLELMRSLTAKDPSNAGWRRDLAVSRKRVGLVLLDRGRTGEALVELERAVETLDELAASDSTNSDWQRELASALQAHGSALEAAGFLDAALAEVRRALEIQAPLLASERGDLRAVLERAAAHLLLGRIQESLGRPREAREAWQLAVRMLRPVASESPRIELLELLARSLLRLDRVGEARPIVARLETLGFADPGFRRLCRSKGLLP